MNQNDSKITILRYNKKQKIEIVYRCLPQLSSKTSMSSSGGRPAEGFEDCSVINKRRKTQEL